MLLSIIIPSFRQGVVLRQALISIEKQIFKDYEIIVMDGGSDDETSATITDFKHLPLAYYSEPDKGIYDAMNKGINISVGDYIYFMGCDDSLASEMTLSQVFDYSNILQNQVIYGDVIFTGTGARHDGEFTYFKLYMYNICHQAIFVRRELFKTLGLFDVRYKIFADWEFNMRWFDAPWVKRQYVPIVIANYNTTGISSTLQDEIFFDEQAALKQRYFPKIIRYLAVNSNRFVHSHIIKFLTYRRIIKLNLIRGILE